MQLENCKAMRLRIVGLCYTILYSPYPFYYLYYLFYHFYYPFYRFYYLFYHLAQHCRAMQLRIVGFQPHILGRNPQNEQTY